ncbi:glycosyltransferase [Rhodohalobacter sp.]|uniref:glycosyltransferase n=1 Tax=Rhodohalobacter sp. TaxID=1974210 RepID=UPI002ACE30D2|nr:glycosyltransferase [Rhodohalobacter sp.]MDZ7755185.1 glycosyltransferase [Rhodohalobacter sp.]
MKILFVIEAAFDPYGGGVQRTTFKLGKHFYEKGLDVSYLSLTQKGHMETVDYGTLYHVQSTGGAGSAENQQFIRQVLKNVSPDIVINQHPYTYHLRNILSEMKEEEGYKLIGCLRNSLFSFKDNLENKVKEKLAGSPLLPLANNKAGLSIILAYHYLKHRRDLKRIIDKHDYFILLAPPNRQELEYFVGSYKPEKVRAIPNSIPEVHSPGEKEKLLLYVGRLGVSQKRADLIAPLWERIHKKLPEWNFMVVGDGDYRETLLKEIEHLPRIESIGQADPNPYYKKASILVMTSAYEGFPNVLLEAQSYGVVPVLFNSYSAAPWVTTEEKDGCLVEPFDLDAMADSVVELTEDKEKLEVMSKAALESARRFTVDEVGKDLVFIF